MITRQAVSLFLVVICLSLSGVAAFSLQGELRKGSSGSGEEPALRLPNPPVRRRPAATRTTPAAQSTSNRPLGPNARVATAKPTPTPPLAETLTENPQVDEEIELGNLARDAANKKVDELQDDSPSFEMLSEVSKQYSNANRHYWAATRLDPNDYRAYFGLGAVYVDGLQRNTTASHSEAIKNFQKVIELKPDLAEAYVGLAYASAQNQEYAQAISAAQKAIQLKPDYPESYYTLGYAYFTADRYQEAVQPFRKAISLKPTYDRAYRTLGSLYISLKQPEERLGVFKQWVMNAPQKPEAHMQLGSAYLGVSVKDPTLEIDEYEQAVQSFKQALKLKPNWPTAHYQLGLAYHRMGDRNAAMEQYRILQRLDPELAAALLGHMNR